ncbi:MAG: DUF808 domain-containing protein [Myxococcales bacterium]|nr:DUF808 domain-containing protein [Myxococcales bacterium]
MATSLLALLDDIASLLDDVAALTKVATTKTAGVLADDLALNAQQVAGVDADRELPVVFAVAKGSLVNKAILVPAALAISAATPRLVTPLLMMGGLFLCYEGAEKVVHKVASRGHADAPPSAPAAVETDPAKLEAQKIKGAIRTDFILSAEIIVIALGSVTTAPLRTRLLVLVALGLVMTVGVYGVVAAIVKLDDAGLALLRTPASARLGGLRRAIGRGILRTAPWLMKALSVGGTLAMFLVGGSILLHGFPAAHHAATHLVEGMGVVARAVLPKLFDLAAGVAAGLATLLVVATLARLRRPAPPVG